MLLLNKIVSKTSLLPPKNLEVFTFENITKEAKILEFHLFYIHITLKYFINVLKLAAGDILCGIIVCK